MTSSFEQSVTCVRIDHSSNARRHLVIHLEICAGVGDELAVCGMVDCLDPNNLPTQYRHVALDMLYELCLRIGGPRYEHGTGIGDSLYHALKEILIRRYLTTANAVGLVMNMARRIVGVQHKSIDLRNVEMKYARFMVIDPDDGVIVA
jgi:hypothetical protein